MISPESLDSFLARSGELKLIFHPPVLLKGRCGLFDKQLHHDIGVRIVEYRITALEQTGCCCLIIDEWMGTITLICTIYFGIEVYCCEYCKLEIAVYSVYFRTCVLFFLLVAVHAAHQIGEKLFSSVVFCIQNGILLLFDHAGKVAAYSYVPSSPKHPEPSLLLPPAK